MTYSSPDLTYCTNVHPGESTEELLANIENFIGPVRKRRGLDEMAVGIWFSARAAEELQEPANRYRLKSALGEAGLWPTSINGFPFGNFHRERLKEAVYEPSWDDPERLQYTLNLAELAGFLLSDAPNPFRRCAISTVPLGFAEGWTDFRTRRCIQHLLQAEEALGRLSASSGVELQLCLEMEPGCALEHTDQVLKFWQDLKMAANTIELSVSRLGLCYDICHQAVQFEDITASLQSLQKAGVPVFKYQVSSAIEMRAATSDGSLIQQRLQPFCDARYLHQTNVLTLDGTLDDWRQPGRAGGNPAPRFFLDLDQALQANTVQSRPDNQVWRIHYHVPVHLESLDASDMRQRESEAREERGNYETAMDPVDGGSEPEILFTTQAAIREALEFLSQQRDSDTRPVLEVETYTWNVLPEHIRARYANIVDAVVLELQWLENELLQQELLTGNQTSASSK